jgi:predicted MFS family arabinose efflux permease
MESEPPIHSAIYYSSATASVSSFLFGISLTVTRCMEPTVRKLWSETMDEGSANSRWGIVCGTIFLGCLLSNIAVNIIKPNRKKTLISNNLLYVLGYLLFLYSQSYPVLLGAKLILGLASGIGCALVPLYIAFISPPRQRGFLLSFHSTGIILGITCGHALAGLNGDRTWRIPILLVLLIVLIDLFALGKIMDTLEEGKAANKTLWDLLKKGKAARSILIAALLHVSQHLCGVDYVMLFLDNLFRSYAYPNMMVSGVSLFAVCVTIVSSRYVDSLGRKPLVLLSAAMTGAATFMFGLSLFPVPTSMLFMFGYNVGLSSIPWFITSEIFPTKYADPASLLAVSLNWACAYGACTVMYPLHVKYGPAVFFSYSASMALFMCIMGAFFKETKGRLPNYQ